MGGGTPTQRREALEAFGQVLAEMRAAAGKPSFREMAARSGAISHTTLHDAVRGTRLPSWETVVEFARACDTDPQPLRAEWERTTRLVRGELHPDAPSPSAPVSVHANDPAGTQPSDTPATDPPPGGADGPASAPPADDTQPLFEPPSRHRSAPTQPVRQQPDPAPPAPVVAVPTTADGGSAPSAHGSSSATGAGDGAQPRHRPALVAAASVAGVAVIGGLAFAAAGLWGRAQGQQPDPSSSSSGGHAAADCPVKSPRNPSTPRHGGDHARFVRDVTLPDCTHVRRSKVLRKTWRLENTGSVHWKGYALRRVDDQTDKSTCQTIRDVPIPPTPPGRMADITTTVTTPSEPTFCYARFKLVDGDGEMAFDGGRPITFQLIVD